jgi:hypothetical protein
MDSAEFQGRLFATNWWKTTPPATRTWLYQENADPAAANSQIYAQIQRITDLAAQMGFDPHGNPLWTRHIAYQSLLNGWNEQQINDALVAEYQKIYGATATPPLGSFATTMQSLRELGASNFMMVDQATLNDMAHKIVSGEKTIADYQLHFAGLAKSWFPNYSDQLDQGLTMQEIYAPIRQQIAGLLEINPADIDPMADHKWLVPLGVGAETSKTGVGSTDQRAMTMYELQQWVRQMPEWSKTTQAREQSASLGQKLLETFGKVA